MGMPADRYAKALLDLAVSDGEIETYQEELETVSQIYEAETGLREFLQCPGNDRTARKNMLVRAFEGAVGKNILSLLLLLLEKGRMNLLPEICSEYIEQADETRNILHLKVTVAFPLDEARINGIGEKYREIYHASSVKITLKTDRSLIGGVMVAVGDRLYDGTVKGKLSSMRSAVAGQESDRRRRM